MRIKFTLNKCFLAYILINVIAYAHLPFAMAQQVKTVTGVVNSKQGNQTLPGVSVKVKNSAVAVMTNTNGVYSIKCKDADVLVFSSVGFEAVEIAVGKKTVINATLKDDPKLLNDVVVIGYGAVKKADLTGSVGQVKMAELETAPVMSFEQALAGRVAGVQVSSSSGQPGKEGLNIVIRGAGSLTQSNAPLYVVDGFPNESFDAGTLNMNDIESINILKDASAIAIYGARGANGVIIVETKKGKIGEPVITYNGSLGFQDLRKRLEMMKPYEFVKYEIERGFGERYLQGDPADPLDDRTLDYYANVAGVDWQDEFFRTGKTNIHNLAVRGGTGQTRYSVSGSVYDNEAVIINTGNGRYQGRISLDQTINKKIRGGINLNYSSQSFFGREASATSRDNAAVSSYLLFSVLGYRPVTGSISFNEDDFLNSFTDSEVSGTDDYRVNPILATNNEYNKSIINNLATNAFVQYDIIKGLALKSTVSLSTGNSVRSYFYNANTPQGNPNNPQNSKGQWGGKDNRSNYIWSNENTLTYKKTINKDHSYDAMVGFSTQKGSVRTDGFSSINVGNPALGVDGLSAGTPFSAVATASEYTLESYLSRVNYNYKSKYLFTATFRADGSSRFPEGQRWGYFPSGALAWRMSSEPFMKSLSFVSDAKLRVSYGLTGNNRVDDYASFNLLNTVIDASYSWNNGSPTLGTYVSRLGNSDLKWETSAQTDIGYDLSLFKGRIELVADVYRKDTKDLLLNAAMPSHTGFTTVYKNIGAIRNEGVELTLNTINIKTKNFSWQSNFNITFNKNKVLALTEGESNRLETIQWYQAYTSTPLYITEVGQPAGQFLGFIWEGNYQYSDFDETAPGVYKLKTGIPNNGNTAVQPGDIKYKDLNGDGTVNDNDRTIIGRGTPIHTGGFSTTFNYKGFNLGVFFQWSYGNDIINANKVLFEGSSLNLLNQFASYENRWTTDNPTNENYRVAGFGPAGRYSSKLIEDGSYLRLKTLSIGYDIPAKILSRFKIKNLGFTAAAQNLLTWTKYTGYDPEVSTRNSVLTPGFDYSAYPNARTMVFGLKLTL